MDDFGLLVGRYLSTLPTLTNEELSELQLDSFGRLILSGRYLEDSAHVSADAGLFTMGVRDDGVAATATVTVVDYTLLSGDTLTVGGTALVEGVDWTAATSNSATATSLASAINALSTVNASAVGAVITIVAATPGSSGNSITLATSDATNLTISGATLTGGADNTIFTSDNYDYSPFAVDKYGRLQVVAELDVNFDYVFAEDSPHTSGDLGAYVLAVRQDTLAISTSTDGDYASFKVNDKGELYVIDKDANASLDAIESDADAIRVELLDQGLTLDSIDTSLNNIESDIDNINTNISDLTKAEDAVHSSGDKGIMALTVRNDNNITLTSADGDYSSIAVDLAGRIKTRTSAILDGSEQYTVTDALAPAGDGVETITAAATPWVTVASLSHTSGTAYVYGWQWACDQNADARLITDDGADVIVYKRALNSSAIPTYAEHWDKEGRIEIAGTAGLAIKLQIKKRSSTGGNASGTGSFHARF